MRILIDADGCPVVNLALETGRRRGVPVLLFCDTAHIFSREGAETITVSKGADSVDFALVGRLQPGGYCSHPGLRSGRHVPGKGRSAGKPGWAVVHAGQYGWIVAIPV